MWENLNTNPNPEIMAAFEDVLAKLTGDLERKTAEQEDFENTLKSRNKSNEAQLQVLYEEMEQQIQRERKAIRAEEEQREKRTRKELEAVLEMKDAQVNGLLLKQKTMQVRHMTWTLAAHCFKLVPKCRMRRAPGHYVGFLRFYTYTIENVETGFLGPINLSCKILQ